MVADIINYVLKFDIPIGGLAATMNPIGILYYEYWQDN